jgi:hypothetical protein
MFLPFLFEGNLRHRVDSLAQVAARIDSVDKLLIAHDLNHRDKTLREITAAAQARIRIARGKVVAANIARVCQLQTPR